MALGFTQEPGIDYEETFTPIVKMTTVCTLLTVTTVYWWPLHQLDVTNTFFTSIALRNLKWLLRLFFHILLSMYASFVRLFMTSGTTLVLGLSVSP